MRDLARHLRQVVRLLAASPDGLRWLLVAGAVAAFLPFLMERLP